MLPPMESWSSLSWRPGAPTILQPSTAPLQVALQRHRPPHRPQPPSAAWRQALTHMQAMHVCNANASGRPASAFNWDGTHTYLRLLEAAACMHVVGRISGRAYLARAPPGLLRRNWHCAAPPDGRACQRHHLLRVHTTQIVPAKR